MRVAGVRQSFSQHAVYQQRVPAAILRSENSPCSPSSPSVSDQVLSGKGHAPTLQMRTWRCRAPGKETHAPASGVGGPSSPPPAHWSMGLSQQPPQPLSPDPERCDAGRPPGEGATPAGRSGGTADPALLPEAHPRPAAQSRRAAAPPAPGEVPGRAARGLPG